MVVEGREGWERLGCVLWFRRSRVGEEKLRGLNKKTVSRVRNRSSWKTEVEMEGEVGVWFIIRGRASSRFTYIQ